MDEYFFAEDTDDYVMSGSESRRGLPAERILLSTNDAKDYKDFLLSADRTQVVVVCLSTSIDVRQTFELAVRSVRAKQPDIIGTARFFAAPLPLRFEGATPSRDGDAFDDVFQEMHKLPRIPDTGLHVMSHFVVNSKYGVQLGEENAKILANDPSLTVSEWEEKIIALLQEVQSSNRRAKSHAAADDDDAAGSFFASSMKWASILYLVVILLPRIFEHRGAILRRVRVKHTWLYISLFIMYLSLSGTFYTIIHSAPLFYIGSQGTFCPHNIYI